MKFYVHNFLFFCKYLEKVKLICNTCIEIIRNIDFYIFKNIEINDILFIKLILKN